MLGSEEGGCVAHRCVFLGPDWGSRFLLSSCILLKYDTMCTILSCRRWRAGEAEKGVGGVLWGRGVGRFAPILVCLTEMPCVFVGSVVRYVVLLSSLRDLVEGGVAVGDLLAAGVAPGCDEL